MVGCLDIEAIEDQVNCYRMNTSSSNRQSPSHIISKVGFLPACLAISRQDPTIPYSIFQDRTYQFY